MFVYTEELANKMTLAHSNQERVRCSTVEFVKHYLYVIIERNNGVKEYYKFDGNKWVLTLSYVGTLTTIDCVTKLITYLTYVFDLTEYSKTAIVEIAKKVADRASKENVVTTTQNYLVIFQVGNHIAVFYRELESSVANELRCYYATNREELSSEAAAVFNSLLHIAKKAELYERDGAANMLHHNFVKRRFTRENLYETNSVFYGGQSLDTLVSLNNIIFCGV